MDRAIALTCPIERKSLNQPTQTEEQNLTTLPQYRSKLINAQTQKDQNQAMWEILKDLGILSNMTDKEREGLRGLQERFS